MWVGVIQTFSEDLKQHGETLTQLEIKGSSFLGSAKVSYICVCVCVCMCTPYKQMDGWTDRRTDLVDRSGTCSGAGIIVFLSSISLVISSFKGISVKRLYNAFLSLNLN